MIFFDNNLLNWNCHAERKNEFRTSFILLPPEGNVSWSEGQIPFCSQRLRNWGYGIVWHVPWNARRIFIRNLVELTHVNKYIHIKFYWFNFRIFRLLDAEDVDTARPDEKSILTYIASYYHTFAKMKNEQKSGKRIANVSKNTALLLQIVVMLFCTVPREYVWKSITTGQKCSVESVSLWINFYFSILLRNRSFCKL